MRSRMTRPWKINMFFVAIAMVSLIVGCVEHQPKPVSGIDNCPIPSGHMIGQAFDTARSTLSNPVCRYKFGAIFNTLLKISEGDPKMENKELFSNLLVWSKDEGIISHRQAKEIYSTYFSSRFVSLPTNHQTCSHCIHLEKIVSDCKSELKKKEQGLLKICGDKETYAKAHNELQTIQLILEATCRACTEG